MSTNDRELLELAAKAAGIKTLPPMNSSPILWDISDDENHRMWNPLADDGDALRLAVKLKIIPHMDEEGVSTGYERIVNVRRPYHQPIYEAFGTDELAATRRAIVRAAAEKGRTA